jgi:hypothetical protein
MSSYIAGVLELNSDPPKQTHPLIGKTKNTSDLSAA